MESDGMARLVPEGGCPVCGGTRLRIAAALRSAIDDRDYRAVRCPSCDLIFADPIPNVSFDSLQDLYDEEYTSAQREPDSAEGRARELLRSATHRQMEIVERHVAPGTALNVGAMSEASQVLAERGWSLRVVEVSRHAAETARLRWGFDVVVSRIEEFEAAPGSFDFVKLGHVIEHLPDPGLALRRVAGMIRRGGALLIDTDNALGLRSQLEFAARRLLGERTARGLVRRFTGKNLSGRYGRLIPPIHLYTFSERNLLRLLDDAGFEPVEIFKPAWGDPTWFPLGDLAGLSLPERAFLMLDRIGARFGRGEVIAVLALRR